MTRFHQALLFTVAVSVFGAACIDSQGEVAEQELALANDDCNCPAVYEPVCGVDGATYSNACNAGCEGVAIDHEGECEDCICSSAYEPICGADGVTYSNACRAACESVATAHVGECEVEDSCRCPAVYDPVCGANGRTYSNSCALACAQVASAHAGECGIEGDSCGGLAGGACSDSFKCRYDFGVFEAAYPDALGSCVADNYCDVPRDCAGFPAAFVPGTWACEANACAWQTGNGWFAVAGWRFTSAHPYASNASQWQELTLPEGATALRLRALGSFGLERGFDHLEVWSRRNGGWVRTRTFTGRNAPSVNDEIPGREHYLHFVSDGSITGHGFDVTADWKN